MYKMILSDLDETLLSDDRTISKEDDTTSHIYDLVMMFTIFMSIIPLAFKQETKLFTTLDLITVIIFIIDYLLR